MRSIVMSLTLCVFCLCAAGCETMPNGDPDPIKSVQKWDNWVKENMW